MLDALAEFRTWVCMQACVEGTLFGVGGSDLLHTEVYRPGESLAWMFLFRTQEGQRQNSVCLEKEQVALSQQCWNSSRDGARVSNTEVRGCGVVTWCSERDPNFNKKSGYILCPKLLSCVPIIHPSFPFSHFLLFFLLATS